MAGAAMPSTASFRPPTTISGTRWTRTTSISTSRSTWPTRRSCRSRRSSSCAARRSPTGWTTRQKIQLANDVTHWSISNLLHGEQGALSLSASLCHVLLDPGAQEYAANQAREEARHVAGFTRYIAKRWGAPLPVGKTIATVLADLVSTPEVYKKIVGMQMLIEGLAMGAFATFNAKTNDPVLRRLVQLVMSDEAFHHRFGRLWAAKTIRHLSDEEHKKVEDWAAQIFQMLLFNLINTEQKQVIYAKYGLDWEWVRDAVKETFGDEERRAQLKESTNIFRVLIKTLLHAGIITSRTAPLYAVWVDMEELKAEGDGIPGDIVAEEMLVVLREINAKRNRIGAKDVVAASVTRRARTLVEQRVDIVRIRSAISPSRRCRSTATRRSDSATSSSLRLASPMLHIRRARRLGRHRSRMAAQPRRTLARRGRRQRRQTPSRARFGAASRPCGSCSGCSSRAIGIASASGRLRPPAACRSRTILVTRTRSRAVQATIRRPSGRTDLGMRATEQVAVGRAASREMPGNRVQPTARSTRGQERDEGDPARLQGFLASTKADRPARRLIGKSGSSAAQTAASRPLVSAPCFLRLLLGVGSLRVARRTAAASGKTKPK